MDVVQLMELLLRGATIGALLTALFVFLGEIRQHWKVWLGITFLAGTITYTYVSTPVTDVFGRDLKLFLALFATCNSVLFWWFATALFDDEWDWAWWRIEPLVLLIGMYLLRRTLPGLQGNFLDDFVQQILVVAMMAHAIWLALSRRKDDLIEDRRLFRVVFVGLAGLFGVIVAFAELGYADQDPPDWITLLHASGLCLLTLGMSAWMMRVGSFFSFAPQTLLPQPAQPSADSLELERLEGFMQAGRYREEGLTIGALADAVGVPEHRLRRLINGALGYRNFTAYLNQWRFAEAKRILQDPAQARRQITEIALDLGYGSLGPFNRAFKAETGLTPTAFRNDRN